MKSVDQGPSGPRAFCLEQNATMQGLDLSKNNSKMFDLLALSSNSVYGRMRNGTVKPEHISSSRSGYATGLAR